MGELDITGMGAAEKMNDISALRFIPPAREFDLDAILLDAGARLVNLHLEAAMREKERLVMIENDFHARRRYCANAVIRPVRSLGANTNNRQSKRYFVVAVVFQRYGR